MYAAASSIKKVGLGMVTKLLLYIYMTVVALVIHFTINIIMIKSCKEWNNLEKRSLFNLTKPVSISNEKERRKKKEKLKTIC